MIFTIKMRRKKRLANDFYYNNALEMIFIRKIHKKYIGKWFLQSKCIRNDFTIKKLSLS